MRVQMGVRISWAMAGCFFLSSRVCEAQGGGPASVGGFGNPAATDRQIVKRFDKDADGRLDRQERQQARAFLRNEGGGRGPGRRRGTSPAAPGHRVAPSDVKSYPDAPLYQPDVLRTFFLSFEDADWEAELADFYNTDVEVPATLAVDGKTYPGDGVKFRGSGSYTEVPAGYKRSLKIKLDAGKKGQNLYGYRTLNLNNAYHDPGFVYSALYSQIARTVLPAPKVNLTKVVINGENWGVYVNALEFDKEFLQESFGSAQGERWKMAGNRFGEGAFKYLGEDPAPYKRQFEPKTKVGPEGWKALVRLSRTLNLTPVNRLQAALEPMLDIDGALWFLALENVLVNSDGYWSKASDFNLYLDGKGRFHVVPHDTNETFEPPEVPRFGPKTP